MKLQEKWLSKNAINAKIVILVRNIETGGYIFAHVVRGKTEYTLLNHFSIVVTLFPKAKTE